MKIKPLSKAIVSKACYEHFSSFLDVIKADLVANGGSSSFPRFIRLLLTSSGYQLLLIFRIQTLLKRLDNRAIAFLREILMQVATKLTGCHIHADAHLEAGIYLPHATGIVIGRGTVVRKNVTIYQNVTLGIAGRGESDYPELYEGCTIYSGAQVFGKVVVGTKASVGANAVVLQSVPAHALAVGVPARIIQK